MDGTSTAGRPPLEGVRVLDFSRILSGPYCSMMLADWGADVVKVERPGSGDDTRQWGPPFLGGESAYFLSVNRNKRSLALDLSLPEGRRVVYRLAERADVVIENFRPGTADRLGIGYRQLRQFNPRLVYCSISGFGQTGPDRDRPGFDAVAQAMSGMMSLTGEPGGEPTKHGMSVADLAAGMWAAFAIVVALYERQRSGEGQYLDVSLLDGQIAWLTYAAGAYFATGRDPERLGSAHPTIVPYQPFATTDGHIMVAVGNDRLWRAFCEAAELPELAADPRFATNPARVEHRAELVPILAARLATRSSAEWTERFDRAGVPSGPILGVGEALAHPQVRAREMVVEVEHPVAGRLRMTGLPVKFSRTPGRIALAPPLLGQQTREILREAGFDEAEMERLQEAGAIPGDGERARGIRHAI
ncbi:MAG: CoA transferase [Clostridia bacterium]|nr:CoA transferase [Clostridia bacterium]